MTANDDARADVRLAWARAALGDANATAAAPPKMATRTAPTAYFEILFMSFSKAASCLTSSI